METAQRTWHWTKRFCDRGSWPQIAHAFDTWIEPDVSLTPEDTPDYEASQPDRH